MNNTNKQQGEGFTIIEVVLVLAIAALILLMVFLALPALQRGQRDTQRKNDISRLQSAVTNYKSNNRGQPPAASQAAWQGFFTSYLKRNGDAFADPSGSDYVPQIQNSTSMPGDFDSVARENIYIYPGAKCNGSAVATSPGISTSARNVAVVKPLEAGGFFCAEA